GERSVSAQQAFDLLALVERARREPVVTQWFDHMTNVADMRVALRGTAFLAGFESFLELYGHRGRYETDWALPRYTEDPTPLLHAIRAHLQQPTMTSTDEVEARQQRESQEAWAAFTARLT